MSLISVSNLKRKINWKNIKPSTETPTTNVNELLGGAIQHSVIWKISPDNKLFWKLESEVGNREVRPSEVKKIQNDIKAGINIMEIQPIIVALVKGKPKIKDGQHRVAVARLLGIPFYVIIDNDFDPRKIISMNNNRKNWVLSDWLAHHITCRTDNKRSYVTFKKMLEAHPYMTIGAMVAIFENRYNSKRGNQPFKKGLLYYGTQNAKHIDSTLKTFVKTTTCALNPVLLYETYSKQNFQYSILQVINMEDFNYARFLKNLSRAKHNLNRLTKTADIVNELCRIERMRTKKKEK